jgi:type III secretory pathway component EscS
MIFFKIILKGCGAEISINELRMFGNCSCGVDIEIPLEDSIATEGACSMSSCQPYYIAFQGLVITAAALIASTFVGKLIIAIRAVLPQDKSLAISIELLFVGIIVYVPGKFLYAFIADKTCQYLATDGVRCFLHESPLFGDWINMVTAGFIVVGVIFEVLLLFSIGDLFLYGDEEPTDLYRPIEMNTYARNGDSVNPPESEPEQQVMLPSSEELFHEYLLRIPPPSPPSTSPSQVTYAQIQRHNAETAAGSQLDFRLQAPLSDGNSSIISDYRSATSNGYANFPPMNRQTSNNRTQSPETSF